MGLTSSFSRLSEYYSRHGLRSTVRRAVEAGKRALFAGRMVVFYCDLDDRNLRPVNVPKSFAIERITSLAEISAEVLQEITSFWNPKLANQNIRERFDRGASLWLVKSDDRLAGYGWTLHGQTIAEYYFPLGQNDVQLFDFYVFPKFRGRALHWLLTGYILQALTAEGRSRAFADTGEWNQAQLASFKMTPFRCLGLVRTFTAFGRVFTWWVVDLPADLKQPRPAQSERAIRAVSTNE
ncbi:MAG TPA: GNAT family N-acetyltransferase [Acidobacteriaceae bacterium]|jgi:hypothetical protein|nr:GNAT family N-acetyltransferase [Acidobacteriaceae bacterium]